MFSTNNKISSTFIFGLKAILGIGLFIYVFKKNNIQSGDIFGEQAALLLVILITIQVIIFIFSSIRWVLIARSLNAQDLTIKKGLIFSWIGQGVSSFLPGIISSDITKMYYINELYPDFKDNAKAIIADRIIGLLCLSLLSAVCLASYLMNWSLWQYVIGSFLIFGALISGASWIHISKRIPKSAFLISYVTFSLKAFSFVVIILFLNLTNPVVSDFYLAMLGQIFEIIPLTPANLGVGHLVYDVIYALKPLMAGAIIYNYYFLAKVIFKLSGILAWIGFRR